MSSYGENVLVIERKNEFEHIATLVNRNWQNPVIVSVDMKGAVCAADLFTGGEQIAENGAIILRLAPLEVKMMMFKD